MNAVERARKGRPVYVICDAEGRYLEKAYDGTWRWTNDKARARPFHYLGSAYRRAAGVGGVVLALGAPEEQQTRP